MKYELERWLKERKRTPHKLDLQDWLHTRDAWKSKQHDVITRTVVGQCVVLDITNQRH